MGLDLGYDFVPRTISDLLIEVSRIDDIPQKLAALNNFLYVLEQELKKIDALKDQIPVCRSLLVDAIRRVKEDVEQCSMRRAAMEEFMASKGSSDEGEGIKNTDDSADKKDWMSSARLWSFPDLYERKNASIQQHFAQQISRIEEDGNGIANLTLLNMSTDKNIGAFMRLKKPEEGKAKVEQEVVADGLSLSIPVADGKCGTNGCGASQGYRQERQQQRQNKKERRCWSPDLHSRFVNALQALGGAQGRNHIPSNMHRDRYESVASKTSTTTVTLNHGAATPKRIKELMQVQGLTNDEVKSHLQKYRLHFGKPSSSSGARVNCNCLRMAESFSFQHSKMGESGSPEGPFQLGGSSKWAYGGEGSEVEDGEVRKP